MDRFLRQFNWRFLLVRILVNAIALAITAAVTPKIYFVDKSVLNWLLMTLMLGVLNALLKPLLQFLTLQFIFVTYGLVIVLVNALLLWLLSIIFPDRFAIENIWWLLVGGLVLGLVSSFLESLLGLTMPIVPEESAELRRLVEEEARQVDWLAAARGEAVAEVQVPATELPAADASAAGPAEAEPTGAGPPRPAPDEAPPPPAAAEAGPPDVLAMPPAEEAASGEAVGPSEGGVAVDPQPAPGPQEEQREDRP